MSTVDPKSVYLICPTHDGNVNVGFAGALMDCNGLFAGISFVIGMSNVAMARNSQVHMFLRHSQFEHLLFVDADIQWTRRDLELLYEGDEQIVCAEYSKKNLIEKKPAQFGLGFCRVHRSVFEAILDDKNEAGEPMVDSFIWQDEVLTHFFPTGVGALGGPAPGRWMGEDHGFFFLAQHAKATCRLETRTNLLHWGRQAFAYRGHALTASGQEIVEALPQVPT